MHEEALVHDLRRKLDQLSQIYGGRAIVRAHVAVGTLSHLDEPRLRELWSRAMAGGPAADAVLSVDTLAIDDPAATSVVLRSVTFEEDDAPGRGTVRTGAPRAASSSGPA